MAREYYIKEIIDTNHQVFTYLIVQLPKFIEMKEARNSDNYLSEKVKGASNEEFKVTKSLLGMIEKIKNEAHDDDLEQLIYFALHAFNSANESLKIIKDILSEKKSLDNRLASVSKEKNNLERERNEWRTKFINKNKEYEDERLEREKIQKELDKLKDERLRETRENASEKSRLERENSTLGVELSNANNQVADLTRRLESSNTELTKVKNQLEDTKTELSLVRIAKDDQEIALIGKIDQKQQQLETVRQSLADLRVESERDKSEKDIEINQKNNELRAKEKELKQKEEQIKKLRSQKGLSHEELLTEKLTSKKRNLELFATELRIDLEQIHSLSKYHERLFLARKNHNQSNIDVHEANITRVKQEFQNTGISIVNIQEICEKCERIAELLWELEQAQQQFQAQQEVPVNN